VTSRRITEVRAGSAAPYPVFIGDEATAFVMDAWQPGWTRAVVVADDNTAVHAQPIAEALRAAGIVTSQQRIAPGEGSKTRAGKAALEDAMLAEGADRKSCIVAVGGGVVLDLAGFVAGTFMRGIPHLFVATSLLAQVDAALGGKTAINTPAGKNLVGVFHHPRAVYVDTAALDTLPASEMRNGLAEAVKHAMLWDRALFAQLMGWSGPGQTNNGRPSEALIARCVAIKAEVVEADARDEGMRNILNYGHTVAHAIEGASHGAVPHGQAVAIGMVVETRLAVRRGDFAEGELKELIALLEQLGLPTSPPCAFDDATRFFARDKKTEDAVIHCAIPQAIGRIAAGDDGRWTQAVSLDELRASWTP
jgi:3-dehydroquinate synthase